MEPCAYIPVWVAEALIKPARFPLIAPWPTLHTPDAPQGVVEIDFESDLGTVTDRRKAVTSRRFSTSNTGIRLISPLMFSVGPLLTQATCPFVVLTSSEQLTPSERLLG